MSIKPSIQTVLSLDFDYFFPEKPEYDWGHQETELFLDAIWVVRAANLIAMGIDIFKDVNVVGSPADFLQDLDKAGWKFKLKRSTSVAESHGSAYFDLKEETGLHIINIDAHHDLCYGQLDKVDCGNWIGKLAQEGRVKKVTIVYPEWKKSQNFDYPNEDILDKMKSFGVEVEFFYGIEQVKPCSIDHVFIARSGAWVPPWTDEEFYKMISTWMFRTKKGFRLWTHSNLEDFLRKFDIKSARKIAKQIKAQHKEVKEKLQELAKQKTV